jgi:hypothetical protein
MASCLAVTASAQQASVPPAPAGSTPSTASTPEWPTSVDRVRDGLSREPVLRLDTQPIFRLEVNERRPRYWDLESLFLFEPEPRGFSGPWHDQFLSMTTPDEARMYGPMNSSGETAQLVATGLLFQGAVKLVQSGVQRWRKGRREGKARAAREEVDAALAAWEAANLAHPQQP